MAETARKPSKHVQKRAVSMADAGNLIDAIKYLRRFSDLSLREAIKTLGELRTEKTEGTRPGNEKLESRGNR